METKLMENDNFWSGRRVFITGGSGFLGFHLVRTLVCKGAHISMLIRPHSSNFRLVDLKGKVSLLEGDVTDASGIEEALKKAKPEIVYHMAAAGTSMPLNPNSLLSANINGTLNILHACLPHDVTRIVYLGSCGEYGDGHQLNESSPLHPSNLYGASKAAGHAIAQAMIGTYNMDIVTARPFATYGPSAPTTRLIPYAILSALQGKDIHMRASVQERDYIFVDDVINGLLLCGSTPNIKGQIFNLCTNTGTSAVSIVKHILNILGSPVKILPGSQPLRPGEMSHQSGSNTNAWRVLRWKPQTSLESGLEKTVEWYRNNMALADHLSKN